MTLNKNLILFSKYYSFIFSLNINYFHLNVFNNSLRIYPPFLNLLSIKLKGLLNFINSTTKKKIIKFSFSGKGFKLENTNKKLYLFFNFSHLFLLILKSILIFRIKKVNFLLVFNWNNRNKYLLRNLLVLRKIDPFNLKGFKISRKKTFFKKKKK